MSVVLRWGVPGFLTVVGGTALSIMMTGENIASDLTLRAGDALATAQFGWASVSFDSRDAIVSGTAASQRMVDDVVARVAAVHGVRSVTSAIVIAESASPFPFEARVDGSGVTLSGGVPDETIHAGIVTQAGAARDDLRLLAGAPDLSVWQAAVDYGLAHLGLFDEGEVRLADLDLSISGRARSPEAYDALIELGRGGAPAGVRLAAVDIAPALVSPFEWHARFDGARIVMSGYTPSEAFVRELQDSGVGGYPVGTSLVLASGAPEGFERTAMMLLENLVRLEEGTASVSGSSAALEGAPPDRETAEAVRVAMAAAGAGLTLAPPQAAIYRLAAVKSGGTIALEGVVPDATLRDRLEALDTVDAAGLELARGAPERFESGVDYVLEALAHMSEGRGEVSGTAISIAGRAATIADFTALETMFALGAPQGLILSNTEVRPPLADPFVWSARKSADGKVRLDGFVPSEALREALQAGASGLVTDASTLADGNPDNFEAVSTSALGVLALLDTGEVTYDGRVWSLSGAVDTPEEAVAAEAALAAAGLREAGVGYTVAAPEPVVPLPVIDPYVWHARKSSDGVVTLDGFVPADDAKEQIAARAGEGTVDDTELGAGAPDGFAEDVLAGLDALSHLQTGTATYEDGRWRLAGVPATEADGAAALAALRDAPGAGAGWDTSLAVPVPPPEPEPELAPEAGPAAAPAVDPGSDEGPAPEVAAVPPPAQTPGSAPAERDFVFTATKPVGGAIALEGRVPFEPMTRWLGVIAGEVPIDALEVGPGLPGDFITSADAGVRALAMLSDGRFGLDGTTWILSGRAETGEQRTAALANLDVLPSTEGWEIDVTLLPPIDVCRQKVDAFSTRNAILFQSGSARITVESEPALDELAGYLAICPEATVHVEGHTDSDGPDDLNLVLSVARAEAVANALIARGVRAERLYSIGYGESLPIADNGTAKGKQANRRIVFTILEEHQ